MNLHQSPYQRKAYAPPRCTYRDPSRRLIETVEDVLLLFLHNTDAIVYDLEVEIVITIALTILNGRIDVHLTPILRIFEGITQEVVQDTFHIER